MRFLVRRGMPRALSFIHIKRTFGPHSFTWSGRRPIPTMNQPAGQDREVVVSKRGLRVAILAEIAALDPELRRGEESELATRFPYLPGWSDAETVLLYVTAFPEEIHTDGLLALADQSGKRVICPRVDRAARELRLHRIENPQTELRPGTLGIPEPRGPARSSSRVDRLGPRARAGVRRARLPPGPRSRSLRPPAAAAAARYHLLVPLPELPVDPPAAARAARSAPQWDLRSRSHDPRCPRKSRSLGPDLDRGGLGVGFE